MVGDCSLYHTPFVIGEYTIMNQPFVASLINRPTERPLPHRNFFF